MKTGTVCQSCAHTQLEKLPELSCRAVLSTQDLFRNINQALKLIVNLLKITYGGASIGDFC
ncbi:hypothetical protein P3T76_002502 [Phytophthora citrophthora]|uniref:Uncharacterized protein n=1 Tax=Phytophthora citrophthora TaxID=4793 RepID=A0AAD9GVP7_9STRA|nr:hypothetical protein P3T76_002502 [Phytophthora citrophthora]